MTIEDLLIQFDYRYIEEVKRDDKSGKAHIIFRGTFTFWDEKARLNNVVVLFDPITKLIRGIKLYGFNLEVLHQAGGQRRQNNACTEIQER